MFSTGNWRDRPRRFTPSHFSIANYSTDINHKAELKEFTDDMFQNLHLISDPLKKNLADQFTNSELTKMPEEKNHMDPEPAHNESTLSGITNLISGFFNVLSSAVFRRARTEDSHQMASDWQAANKECKNGPSDHILGDDIKQDMSDCKTAATNCEDKLNKVRLLLNSRSSSSPVKFRSRRPRRVFVEPNSIEEHFQDAFSPEDYINLANESYLEYYSPLQYQSPEFFDVQSPNLHILSKEVNKTIEIGNHLPETCINNDKPNVPDNVNNKKCLLNQNNMIVEENVSKDQLISSCEVKLMKLKAMLQENRKKNTNLQTIQTETEKCIESDKKPSKSIPINKTKDKRFKNPNRLSDKRKKSQMKQNIQDELHFAYEVTLDQSSYEESPSFHSLENIYEDIPFSPSTATPVDCFDEISGKFCNSNSSEDSFQIVFTDVPKLHRLSDCDSEDSYIVFDDSPDSCYTSNDVFGDSDYECDSDSDLSDSGCANIRLSANLSRTVSNLTDDSLYNEDVVDFAKPPNEENKSGLLLDDRRKELKKSLPPKTVHFSSDPPKVHVMRVWAFAARQARAGHWERYAVDRERFKRRIADVDMAVSWVLKPQHRSRVMFQRFMPWWNAQKRKELAEKKQKVEEERLRVEEERLRVEEEKKEKEQLKVENANVITSGEGIAEIETSDMENDLKLDPEIDRNDVKIVEKLNMPDELAYFEDVGINNGDSRNIHSISKEKVKGFDTVPVHKLKFDSRSSLKKDVNNCTNNKNAEFAKFKTEVKDHDNSLEDLDLQKEVVLKYKNENLSNDMRVDSKETLYSS